MISMAPARIRAAITPETAAPASLGRVEAGEQRPHGLRAAEDAKRDPRGDAERALGADEEPQQVGTGGSRPLPAEVDELAVGQDDLERRSRG